MCLISDCLGITSEGHTKSESTLTNTFHELFSKASGRQIFVTTMSSNISRMYQIMDAARAIGRRMVIKREIYRADGRCCKKAWLSSFFRRFFYKWTRGRKLSSGWVGLLIAGCYGQPGSSLDRLSRGEHECIRLEGEPIVVFSADPSPPGADITVEK